jgi:hypothetical protein
MLDKDVPLRKMISGPLNPFRDGLETTTLHALVEPVTPNSVVLSPHGLWTRMVFTGAELGCSLQVCGPMCLGSQRLPALSDLWVSLVAILPPVPRGSQLKSYRSHLHRASEHLISQRTNTISRLCGTGRLNYVRSSAIASIGRYADDTDSHQQ